MLGLCKKVPSYLTQFSAFFVGKNVIKRVDRIDRIDPIDRVDRVYR